MSRENFVFYKKDLAQVLYAARSGGLFKASEIPFLSMLTLGMSLISK
jgi:hypothetical protein